MMIGSVIPDRNTLICTFPILVVRENDRLGGGGPETNDVEGMVGTSCIEGAFLMVSGSGSRCVTVSWRSCAQGASVGPDA